MLTYKEYLNEQKKVLLEMAISSKDLKDKLEDIVPQVINHVILCLVFSPLTPTTLRHWTEDELYGFLHQVPLLKGKNKLPEYGWLMKNGYKVWSDVFLDRVDSYIKDLERHEKLKAPKYNKNTLYEYVTEYFSWLFTELSTKGIVGKTDIFEEVQELVKLYNKEI